MRNLYGFLPILTVLLMACGNQPSANSSVAVSETPNVTAPAASSPETTVEASTPSEAEPAEATKEASPTTKATAAEKVQKANTQEKAPTEKAVAVAQEKQPASSTKTTSPTDKIANTTTPTKEVKAEVSTPPASKPEVKKEKPAPKAFTHQAWDELLRKHVSSTGKVNYKGFKADKVKFDAYLEGLKNNPIQKNMPRNARMAYWINAYNAFTVKLIVNNYPVKSIMDLHGGEPWKVSWIKLGDKTYSLNEIEHKILRPRFQDARIHFAVNCAAKSCPPLLNRAWNAANLNSNFEKTSKAFINGPMNEISAKKLGLSKIFEWYGEDFGDLIAFLNKYAKTPINANAKIEFVDYDWALNE